MMHEQWCRFKDEEGQEYGSFEVFRRDDMNDEGDVEVAYYWWSCFPGCIPDSDPIGPYDTYEEAYEAAMEY